MSQKVRKFLEDFFSCPICLEVLQQPCTTKCGHNFCAECIRINKYQCAICREQSLPKEVPINYQLKKTIDSLQSMGDDELNNRYFHDETSMKSSFSTKNGNENNSVQKEEGMSSKVSESYCKMRANGSISQSENVNKYRYKRLRSQLGDGGLSINVNLNLFNTNINGSQLGKLENNFSQNPLHENLCQERIKVDLFLEKILREFTFDEASQEIGRSTLNSANVYMNTMNYSIQCTNPNFFFHEDNRMIDDQEVNEEEVVNYIRGRKFFRNSDK